MSHTGRGRPADSPHVARYYCRGWALVVDPIAGDSLNVYRYAKDNPGISTYKNESDEQKRRACSKTF
jgi:hypothetical protein